MDISEGFSVRAVPCARRPLPFSESDLLGPEAALGWCDYQGDAEQLCHYFPSSGSG